MFDIIPCYPTNQENPEAYKAGWIILTAKYDTKNKSYPWYIQVYNLYLHQVNHWFVPSINDTWQYCQWSQ